MDNYNNTFGATPTALADHGFMAIQVYKDATYTYQAFAMPGTPVNEARWAVKRVLTDGSANEGTTLWANGSNAFVNKADDMTALTYK